jgi:predicted RNA binding protein YcfA (HicA-like mRNA interferase family)
VRIPRDLSGRAFAQVLVRDLAYRIVHQRGSHVVLETDTPTHQRIAIPDHPNLRVGTLNAMIGAVARHKGMDKTQVIALL